MLKVNKELLTIVEQLEIAKRDAMYYEKCLKQILIPLFKIQEENPDIAGYIPSKGFIEELEKILKHESTPPEGVDLDKLHYGMF